MLPVALFLASLASAKPAATTAPTAAPAAPPVAQDQARILNETATADGLRQVTIDLSGDNKPEITNFFRDRAGAEPLLMRKDVDLNRDGKVDVSTSFDDAGLRVKEDIDGDFDGRADWVDHYIDGKRSMTEIDTDFNGSFDLFKYFEGGKVRRKERDTNTDNKIDLWEYLDEQGNVTKTGRDIDGDGKMDVRDK